MLVASRSGSPLLVDLMLLSNVSLGSRQPLGFPLSPSAGTVRTVAILAVIRLASIRANNDTANVKYLSAGIFRLVFFTPSSTCSIQFFLPILQDAPRTPPPA